MLTHLTDYRGSKEIRLPTANTTFGPGTVGAKSYWLRRATAVVDAGKEPDEITGISCLPNVALTPGLFAADFLKRTGADHANPESAKAIMGTPLTPELKDHLGKIFALFPELYLIFRSDECTASGVGLWHSGFVLNDGKAERMNQAELEIKRILASEYSPDVFAFKLRTGLPLAENPGVLVMPVAGHRFSDAADMLYTSFIHMNVLSGFFDSDSLIHLGIGLGGANRKGALSSLLSRIYAMQSEFGSSSIHETLQHSKHLMNGEVTDVNEHRLVLTELIRLIYGSKWNEIVNELRMGLDSLDAEFKQPMYYELAYAAFYPFLVQAAPANINSVERPEVSEGSIMLEVDRNSKSRFEQYGSRVSGRGVIDAECYVYIDGYDLNLLSEVNKDAKNYVLFLDAPASMLRERLSFADYSNAAAIVVIDSGPMYSVSSHINGACGDAGIPVILVNQGPLGLTSGEVVKQPLKVYANDAREEAFVAIRD
jgi:hypothetical protein